MRRVAAPLAAPLACAGSAERAVLASHAGTFARGCRDAFLLQTDIYLCMHICILYICHKPCEDVNMVSIRHTYRASSP